ncbi:MAG: hypothetical protein FJX59_03760 [Alphaproteobacteria bacterium]|nr:hypothetical protein [Alphaproteobacteria bacterium]
MIEESIKQAAAVILGVDLVGIEQLLSANHIAILPKGTRLDRSTHGPFPLTSGANLWVSRPAFLTYLHLKDVLATIRGLRSVGAGVVDMIRAADQKILFETPKQRRAMAAAGHRQVNGVDLVKMPRMGGLVEVPIELVASEYRSHVHDYLRPLLNSGRYDAMVELGAGPGDLIVTIARESRDTTIKFIGTEISIPACGCMLELAIAAGTPLLEIRRLDLSCPDLSFLSAFRRPLLLTSGVLCVLQPSPASLFDEILSKLPRFDLVALEPVSFEIAERDSRVRPLITREQYLSQALIPGLWPFLEDWVRCHGMIVERVIPDFSGKRPIHPMSLIHVAK